MTQFQYDVCLYGFAVMIGISFILLWFSPEGKEFRDDVVKFWRKDKEEE